MPRLAPVTDIRSCKDPFFGRTPLSIHPLGRPPDSGPSVSQSLTYEPYYGLRDKPFSLSADPRFLYRSTAHASAFDDLTAAIRRREGLIVLTGDIGTGKTTLCRAVLEQLDRKTFSTFVPDPFMSRNDLLKMILIDFGVMAVEDLKSGRMQGASRPDLSYPLYEFLDSLVPLQAFAVLVIDEAQNLSLPLLEEIRILSDLERREKLLQVVLVGQPEFRTQIKLPQMRQLDQRVSVRCVLQPLGRAGVTGYVKHRLTVASGGNSRVEFASEALDLVHRISKGVPRLINLVCDRSLYHGWLQRAGQIDTSHVRLAIRDLDLEAAASAPPERVAGEHQESAALFEALAPPTEDPVLPVAAEDARDARGFDAMAADEVDLKALLDLAPQTTPDAPAPSFQRSREAPPDASASPAAQRSGPLGLSTAGSDPPPADRPSASGDPARATAVLGRVRVPRASPPPRRAPVVIIVLVLIVAALVGLAYVTGIGIPGLSGQLPELPASPDLAMAEPIAARSGPDGVTPGASGRALMPGVGQPGTPVVQSAFPFVIQVALFRGSTNAGRLVSQLMEAGYRAYQIDVDVGDQGRFRQVLVGPYSASEDAESDLAQIHRIPGYSDARIASTQAGVSLP